MPTQDPPYPAQGWSPVRIEFEYVSGNFREHGHDPALCDLIVCWEHTWKDSPLEVLELKSVLAKMNATPGGSHA